MRMKQVLTGGRPLETLPQDPVVSASFSEASLLTFFAYYLAGNSNEFEWINMNINISIYLLFVSLFLSVQMDKLVQFVNKVADFVTGGCWRIGPDKSYRILTLGGKSSHLEAAPVWSLLAPVSMQCCWISLVLVTSSSAISAPDCSSITTLSSTSHFSSCSLASRDTRASFSRWTMWRLWEDPVDPGPGSSLYCSLFRPLLKDNPQFYSQ